jgi:hypothetical protein
VRAKWMAEGHNADKLIVLPIPLDDPWSWWAFSLQVIEQLTPGPAVGISRDDFTEFLVTKARRGEYDDDGNLQLFRDSYFSLQGNLSEHHAERVRIVEEGLTDTASKELYRTILRGPSTDIWDHYINTTFASIQYFEHIDFSQCRTVLNGGIWLGSELPLLLAVLPEDAVIHNIDPCGHDHLSSYVYPSFRRFRDRCPQHRLALANHTGTIDLEMMPDGQASSTSEATEIAPAANSFPCTTVDEFVRQNALSNVDLIKFDLEGGETDAVEGMRETVRKFRPQLAISIYHRLTDYWELPITLMEMCTDYDFHLGHYSFERFETVFYCIPRELKHNV